jgi:hypothetical protein
MPAGTTTSRVALIAFCWMLGRDDDVVAAIGEFSGRVGRTSCQVDLAFCSSRANHPNGLGKIGPLKIAGKLQTKETGAQGEKPSDGIRHAKELGAPVRVA